jgi:hypothetical protein
MAVLSCLEGVWVSEDKVHEVEVRGGQFQVKEMRTVVLPAQGTRELRVTHEFSSER